MSHVFDTCSGFDVNIDLVFVRELILGCPFYIPTVQNDKSFTTIVRTE